MYQRFIDRYVWLVYNQQNNYEYSCYLCLFLFKR